MSYTLKPPDKWLNEILIVGTGGTGGFVAESLCRIVSQEYKLMLCDFDIVEEPNLGRQNFRREDLGKMKSEVLARRLSNQFGRAIGYLTAPIHKSDSGRRFGVIIGCVDNGLARQDIDKMFSGIYGSRAWYIDSGNGENFGQILIGNDNKDFTIKDGQFVTLPKPSMQRPDILQQVKKVQLACETNDQGPTINYVMASLVVEVVRRLVTGTLPWAQVYCDMEAGTVRSVDATPEFCKEINKKEVIIIINGKRN
jgi:hypothetical protein